MQKTFSIKRYFIILPLVAIFVALVAKPAVYAESIKSGLVLYVTSVLPTLFPMLIFSKLFIYLEAADDLAALLKKPMRSLFRAPSVGGYIFVISMLSGYPIGAKMVSDYYKAGIIDKDDAKKLTSFCMTSGPMFVIGTVGATFFKSVQIGYVILLSHYIAAVICGIIFCIGKRKTTDKPYTVLSSKSKNILSDTFNNSITTVMLVGGYVTLFYMLTEMLYNLGFIAAVKTLCDNLSLDGRIAESFLVSFVEMTRGTSIFAALSGEYKIAVACAAAMISFGGLSVTLQAMSFLKDAEIKTGYYLLVKFVHGVLTFIIAYSASSLFG